MANIIEKTTDYFHQVRMAAANNVPTAPAYKRVGRQLWRKAMCVGATGISEDSISNRPLEQGMLNARIYRSLNPSSVSEELRQKLLQRRQDLETSAVDDEEPAEDPIIMEHSIEEREIDEGAYW